MSRSIQVTDAIQWYEGMLLEPHFFQQNDLRFTQLLHYHTLHTRPFYWGVEALTIDAVTLVGGLFRITMAEGVFQDGLYFNQKITDTPLEFDLKKGAPDLGRDPKMIYLSVNGYRVGDGNATGDFARYASADGDLVSDENTGERPLTFPRIKPKLSLHVGGRPPGHFISLPIAQVTLDENAYRLTSYIPPCLTVPTSSPIAVVCMDILSRLRRKIAHLVSVTQNAAGQTTIQEVRESLRVFITALPPLEAIVYSGCSHPFDVFMALAHLVGQLSTMRLGSVPPVFDFYHHDHLRKTFDHIGHYILKAMDSVQDGYAVIPFAKTDRLYTLKLQADFIEDRFVLGVRTPTGATDQEMETWIQEAVIVTESYVKIAQDRRILGAKRMLIQSDEKLNLLPVKGMTLFEIHNDPTFIRPNESLILFNLSDREGSRPTELMLFVARKKELQDVG